MIATRFRSVYWVGGVAVAALGCYLVSQRVASERASLVKVETAIVMGERQIRALETEIGTRAGMKQIERWNVEVLSLSAPRAGQYVRDEAQLASLVQPAQPAMAAPAPVQVAMIDAAPAQMPRISRISYQTPAPVSRVVENAPSLERARPEKVKREPAKAERVQAEREKPDRPKPEQVKSAKAKEEKPRAERQRMAERKRDAAPKREAAPERDADDAPRVRSAVFVKPAVQKAAAAQKVALLDDKLLGDLGRLARNERTGGKRAR